MRNWTKLYQTYKKAYSKMKTKSKVNMEDMYSKREFMTAYIALEEDRKEEIKQGTRKVANITQDLVGRQVEYKYSYKQAEVIQKQLNELYGEKVSIRKIREGEAGEFWNDVRQAQSELKSQGIHGAKMNGIIASTFFGS